MAYYTYIASNKWNTVLYSGVTRNLDMRTLQHVHKVYPHSFTAKYNINKILWYEVFEEIEDALRAEKQIKGWRRSKKLDLIRQMNPQFEDLAVRDPSTMAEASAQDDMRGGIEKKESRDDYRLLYL